MEKILIYSKQENNFIHYQDDIGGFLLPEPNLLGRSTG